MSHEIFGNDIVKECRTPVLDNHRNDIKIPAPSGNNLKAHQFKWPYNGRYFVDEVMNAQAAHDLLSFDAEFQPSDCQSCEMLMLLDITRTGTHSYTLSGSEDQFDGKIRMSDLEQHNTRIIFIPQKRRHFNKSTDVFCGTKCTYGIKLSTWLRILSSGEIPPNVVEVLHENNGGWGVHTSSCFEINNKVCNKVNLPSSPSSPLCAYHIWIKPRPWWRQERFVYARHDMHSGKNFLLVIGNSLDEQVAHLASRFKPSLQPHLLSTLLAIITTWTKQLEKFLWEQDFATQQLESDTGWSIVFHTQLNPLPPEKLLLRKDMMTTRDLLSHVVRASDSYSELFAFLAREVSSLPNLQTHPGRLPDQLRDTFLQLGTRQWHQKIQANGLIARVDAQWSIVNALIAQHNNSLNSQIAYDSRIDTTIMRRISFVTLVFLPATFLATFFSMSFFHISAGNLVVSPTVWIYVACVIPMTFVVGWQSSTMGSSQVQWITTKMSRIWSRLSRTKSAKRFQNRNGTRHAQQASMEQQLA